MSTFGAALSNTALLVTLLTGLLLTLYLALRLSVASLRLTYRFVRAQAARVSVQRGDLAHQGGRARA